MTENNHDWDQVKLLYEKVMAWAVAILLDEWPPRNGQISRDTIALHEQVLQDFLHHIYEPILGPPTCPAYLATKRLPDGPSLNELLQQIHTIWHRNNTLPALSLIAAHYRSPISVRGRRSSFAVHQPDMIDRLRSLLIGDVSGEFDQFVENLNHLPRFLELYHSVFLEQYFRLFGVPTTMNEWILERLRDKCDAVSVLFGSEPRCSSIELGQGKGHPWIDIAFPEEYCQLLTDPTILRIFHSSVLRSLNQVARRDNATDLLQIKGDGAPEGHNTSEWYRLLREANIHSWTLLADPLVEECRHRRDYVVGRLYYSTVPGERRYVADLLRIFAPVSDHETSARFSALRDVINVFQAMLFYCSLYGNIYLTFPFWHHSAPGCSLTFMRRFDEGGDPVKWIETWRGRLWALGAGISKQIMDRAWGCFAASLGDAPKLPGKLLAAKADVELIWLEIEKNKPEFKKEWLELLVRLATIVASAKHEGRPLAFSFLLGTPQNLVQDLIIEHEFIMRGDDGKSRLRLGPEYPECAYTLSLIKGNYGLLQNPELALFVSHPGLPAEITHIVRLPGVRSREKSRRVLLSAVTRRGKKMLACVSYGNGRAELIFDGVLFGSYSELEGWRYASSYIDFWAVVRKEIEAVGGLPESRLLKMLESVIERISAEPGSGALMVLAERGALQEGLLRGVQLTRVFDSVEKMNVEEIGADLLFQLAVEDGATIIEVPSGIVSGRWQLPAIDPEEHRVEEEYTSPEGAGQIGRVPLLKAWQRPGKYEWKDWHKTLQWGTRHTAALGASLALGDRALVVVISADGPIHVLKNGRGVPYKEGDLSYLG
jgi:hypothetical protein